eukprot:GEMP01088570.1.p1 GENE.GEMP01088570.1~~GEMP01088570.1.p1  ORF type:complete len:130 (+),score=36.76 GEMP01088570.1:47-436(+)
MSGKPEEGHPSIVEDLDFINGKLEEGHPNIVGDLDFIKEHYKDCFQALEIESKDYEADRAVFTLEAKSAASKVRVELSRQHFLILETLKGPDLSGQRFESIEQLLSQMDNFPSLLLGLVARRLAEDNDE